MTGCRNLITDVAGLSVGNAHRADLCSGVTVLLAERPLVAAVDVRGGGPGTRETDALGLAGSVDEVHGLVLSGGSAFGLSAATGAQCWLAERGRGFEVRGARVPIVPQAVLFDLLNGGDKAWGRSPPYEALAREACDRAAGAFALGSAGAGYGAATATLRGGLGSASETLADGLVIGALAAVNAVGTATIGNTGFFWAASFERGGEFGGLGPPVPWPDDALALRVKGGPQEATTLAVVATNARLSKRQAHRLAVMANAGLARALYPVHTPLDGDVVFAAATGEVLLPQSVLALTALGLAAANVLARAVARAVYEAEPAPAFWQGPPAYRSRFGKSPSD
jgi:L-aminopeptidase/D-esterase-like protein